MPRGDRAGPWGAGPRTGRGVGRCTGHDRPGYANAGAGCGAEIGCKGRGRGWRNEYYATGIPGWARGWTIRLMPAEPHQELTDLRTQADRLPGWISCGVGSRRSRAGHRNRSSLVEGRCGNGAAPPLNRGGLRFSIGCFGAAAARAAAGRAGVVATSQVLVQAANVYARSAATGRPMSTRSAAWTSPVPHVAHA
jgi:hypothetical protein